MQSVTLCIMPRQYLLTTLVEILPMLRIAKEALTFDDVLLVPAHSTVLAVGFYKKVGFKVTGRSEVDDLGKPYPLLNLAYVGE